MVEPRDLKSEFNEGLPMTYFANSMRQQFGSVTARNILNAFQKMGLPAPKSKQEFLFSSNLVFLNQYGLVLRIESSTKNQYRVNNSVWVLQPLATINTGNAVIEICPGCHIETDKKNSDYLINQLLKERIDFWDRGIRNVGRMPIKTVQFPEGIPVVIDRPAVQKLIGQPLWWNISKEMKAVIAAQQRLYEPLRRAFDKALPDKLGPSDIHEMKQFWNLCRTYVQKGKLIAGWNERERYHFLDYTQKTMLAAKAAAAYEIHLIKSTDQKASSAAAAIPQSRRRSV